MFRMGKLLDEWNRVQREKADRLVARRKHTLIRLWDGNWLQLAEISGEFHHSFTFLKNDVGAAELTLPIGHEVSDLLLDTNNWPTKSLYLTFDRDGVRWSGRIEGVTSSISRGRNEATLKVVAAHDYKKLVDLLAWPNPFLPAAVQFPKSYVLTGPARWIVATVIEQNLWRKNLSMWALPDDPFNIAQWVNFNKRDWNMVVRAVPYTQDKTMWTTISSRYKTVHDCISPVCEDAGLVIEVRRWLRGDPIPYGSKEPRNGQLIIDVLDRCGLDQVTAAPHSAAPWAMTTIGSALGTLTNGFAAVTRSFKNHGIEQQLETVPRDIGGDAVRDKQWFEGDTSKFPWVVLEDSEYTSLESSGVEYVPPGQCQFVTGGASPAMVNNGIKMSIMALGNVIGAFINFASLGTMAATALEPLYTDVFMAFARLKMHDRIAKQGWDFPFEKWVDGANIGWSIQALLAVRKAMQESEERYSASVKMRDGDPYFVGQNGHGDLFVGDVVGVHTKGIPENLYFLAQVSKVTFEDDGGEMGWDIEVGQKEFESGIDKLFRDFGRTQEALKELQVW